MRFSNCGPMGFKPVVDPCPMDLGRDVTFNAEVSQRSGVALISTTGAYFEAEGIPFMFRHFEMQEIADIYQKEIEDGIGGSGIKPGLIKIATGDGVVSEYERKCRDRGGEGGEDHGAAVAVPHAELHVWA